MVKDRAVGVASVQPDTYAIIQGTNPGDNPYLQLKKVQAVAMYQCNDNTCHYTPVFVEDSYLFSDLQNGSDDGDLRERVVWLGEGLSNAHREIEKQAACLEINRPDPGDFTWWSNDEKAILALSTK
jgi:hypothetical protein